jgi:hypothetical protein
MASVGLIGAWAETVAIDKKTPTSSQQTRNKKQLTIDN